MTNQIRNPNKARVASCLRSSSSSSSSSDCWFTPKKLLASLGPFDLDPANSEPRKFPTAKRHYGPRHDGLLQKWRGRVWLNPPFSNARPWIERMIEHGNGIVLVFCLADAAWFHAAFKAATAVFMFRGRLQFSRPDGTGSRCPLGCVLFAFGESNADSIRRANLPGLMLKIAA